MKKMLFIAIAAAVVSACACFDSTEEAPVTNYRTIYNQPKMDCDYFDGRTCYRYVYRQVQKPVAKPVRYRESRPCTTCRARPVVIQAPACGSCAACSPCQPKITETREPVEIVYKKTVNKTVYEPKTYSEVSYEKVSCMSDNCAETVNQPAQIEVVD